MSTENHAHEPHGKAPGEGGVPDPDPTSSSMPGPASGDVQPGETPPAEDQTSAPQGHEEHGPRRGVPMAWIGGIAVVVVLVALIFVGYATGLF